MQGYQLDTRQQSSSDPFSRSNAHFTSQAKSFDQLLPKKKTHIFRVSKRETLTLTAFRRTHSSSSCCSTRLKDSSPIRSTAAQKQNRLEDDRIPRRVCGYHDLIDKHGVEFHREPLSIADGPGYHAMTSSTGGNRPMPQTLKEVDVVVIGVGFAGSILAKELAASGLKVVGLERATAAIAFRTSRHLRFMTN